MYLMPLHYCVLSVVIQSELQVRRKRARQTIMWKCFKCDSVMKTAQSRYFISEIQRNIDLYFKDGTVGEAPK